MKEVSILIHGPKGTGADPHMTEEGTKMIASLVLLLPDTIPEVWTGEARRHEDVAIAAGLHTHPNRWWSSVFGAAGSLETISGQKMLVLPSGLTVPFDRVTSGQDAGPSVKAKLATLPKDTVICAGREILLALGMSIEQAKSGALYTAEVIGGDVTDTISLKLVAVGTP